MVEFPIRRCGGDLPAEELLERMASADRRLIATLETVTSDDQVEWFGEKLDLLGHPGRTDLSRGDARRPGNRILLCSRYAHPRNRREELGAVRQMKQAESGEISRIR